MLACRCFNTKLFYTLAAVFWLVAALFCRLISLDGLKLIGYVMLTNAETLSPVWSLGVFPVGGPFQDRLLCPFTPPHPLPSPCGSGGGGVAIATELLRGVGSSFLSLLL